jgi:nucleotide sugar dehydrogenase
VAKLLENSYRAANIALIYEWTLLAEETGVNLFEIVDSIRVRQGTHDNMRYPGFGVGGYCLTKDSLLAQWALTHFFGSTVQLGMTLEALRINYQMPLHALELARGMMGGTLAGRKIALCGLCYLPNVPDTRNAPLEIVYDRLCEEKALVGVHDPLVESWPERPGAALTQKLPEALREASVAVLAVNHDAYSRLSAAEWAVLLPAHCSVVDASNVISDAQAAFLHTRGHRLMGVGKGHWRKRGYDQYVQT